MSTAVNEAKSPLSSLSLPFCAVTITSPELATELNSWTGHPSFVSPSKPKGRSGGHSFTAILFLLSGKSRPCLEELHDCSAYYILEVLYRHFQKLIRIFQIYVTGCYIDEIKKNILLDMMLQECHCLTEEWAIMSIYHHYVVEKSKRLKSQWWEKIWVSLTSHLKMLYYLAWMLKYLGAYQLSSMDLEFEVYCIAFSWENFSHICVCMYIFVNIVS